MTLIENAKSQLDQGGESFLETYRTAYSHGLESIYALENVDIKSVRRLDIPTVPSVRKKNKTVKKELAYSNASAKEQQLEFDFGPSYRNSISSFLCREPIQVLGLSAHAERCLLMHGKRLLQDIIDVDLQEFVFLKGMGQGHIEEIRQKLQSYIDGRPLKKCETIDFAAWIRSLSIDLDRKKLFVGLKAYQLDELLSLSPIENVEVNKLTPEKKQEWVREMEVQLKTAVRKQLVFKDMDAIATAFVKPWVRQRLGMASRHELLERLQRVSEDAATTQNALNFLSAMYFENQFPLKQSLQSVEQDIYCVDSVTANHYRSIVEKAVSYFYKTTVQYPLNRLVMLLEQEFGRCWQSFREGFVEKVLRYAPQFSVRKNLENKLVVRLTHIS